MGVPATEAKKGQVLKLDGKCYLVLDYTLMTPGNKRGFLQFKLRDIDAGSVQTKKVSSDALVEVLNLDRQPCEYLYKDGASHIFMNKDTYEQHELSDEDVGDVMRFIVHNQDVTVTFLEERAISIDLPASVELEVTEAPPAIRGNTASGNVTKLVTVETGYQLHVPHFIAQGEKVKIDTRTGDFISRA